MDKRDIGSSLFFLGLGVAISFYAASYGLGQAGTPGPGFLPFLTGIVLILLSLCHVGSIWRKRRPGGRKADKFFPQERSGRKIFLLLFAAIGYAVVLEHLGFVLSTFLFMAIVLKFVESQKPLWVLIGSSLTAFFSYILFETLLKSQLPKGILGM